jgi:signal peptidase I
VDDGSTVRLPLSGASMEPTIPGGARIVVERCEPAALRLGDIVVYEDAARLVCHRVLWRWARGRGALLTKGDRLRVPPAWVAASAVIGRVVAIETPRRHRVLVTPRERIRAHAAAARSGLALLGRPVVRGLRRLTTPARPA